MNNDFIRSMPSGAGDNTRPKSSLKVFMIFLILVFCVGTAFGVYKARFIKGIEEVREANFIKIYALNNSINPEGIPKNFPIEKDASITQNYTTEIVDGRKFQSTRSFISKKSLAENFKIYKDYLIKNKFEIYSENDGEGLKSLFARNAVGDFSIIISNNTLTSEVNVTVNYVFDGKSKQSFDAFKSSQ